MFGLHPYDIAVIAGYLVLMAGVGLYVARRVRDTNHYFLGNRSFGKLLMIGQSFGVGTQADQPVGTAGKAYALGFSGLWYGWKFIFCTPVYWLIAPIYRRLRYITSAEYMEARYGRGIGLLYACYALLFLMINMSAMQNGAAKVVSQATGGAITHAGVVWSMTTIFIFYSLLGGRISAAVTDFLQSFLIIVLSVILVPYGISALGGYASFRSSLSEAQRSIAVPSGLTLGLVSVLSLQSIFSIFSQPHVMASVGTGKTEVNCRVGFTYGNMLKRFCAVGWAFVGLIMIAMVGRHMVEPLADSEAAFGVACQKLLGPGSLGLMVASILATNMSTCSAFMVDFGGLAVQNIYKPFFRPSGPDAHYLNVARVTGVAITLLSMGLMRVMPNVMDALLQSDSLAAFMGVPFIAGLIWRRATRVGALCAFVAGMGVNIALGFLRYGDITAWRQDIFLIAFAASLIGLVAGSLLSRPEPEAAWEALQQRLHTPASVDDVPPAERPARAREAEAAGEGLLFVDLLSLPRTFSFRRYRTDLLGLAAALGVVFLLIAGAIVLSRT